MTNEQKKEILEAAIDWIYANPPTNGYGLLDKQADKEATEIIHNLRMVVDTLKE